VENPFREYLQTICRYCETHPPKFWSAAGGRTSRKNETYGRYCSRYEVGNYGVGHYVRSREDCPVYEFPNKFEIREFESEVHPVVYTVKVFRTQRGDDGRDVTYCCAKGKSKRSIAAAYEPCCRKMISNFGIFPDSKSVEETMFRLSVEAGVDR